MRHYRPRSQAQTVAYPYKLPLVPLFHDRITTTPVLKGPRLVNAIAEKTGESEYQIYKRPALKNYFTLPVGRGRGIYCSQPTSAILSVVGGTVYNTTSPVGTVDIHSTVFRCEDILSSPRTIVMGDEFKGYIVDPLANTIVEITDINFPASFVPGWVYLNGYLYIMDTDGNIWGSANTDDAAVWSSTNVIKASSNADLGVGLFKQLSYVVALKQWTTQVFVDNGNPPPGSPLQMLPEAQTAYGCMSGRSVQQIGESLIWLTCGKNTSPQVARMDNLATRIVSTPDVDRLLTQMADLTNLTTSPIQLTSWSLKIAGHRLYGITTVGQNYSLVYDLDQDLWYFWTDAAGDYFPIIGMSSFRPASVLGSLNLAQHESNGLVYAMLPQDQQTSDAGAVFPVDIYTPNFDAGIARRKTVSMMMVSADQQPGSVLMERHSHDDYQNWSNFRPINLSVSRPQLRDMGTFDSNRAHHFRHQLDTPLRIKAIHLQLDVGSL